MKAFFVVLVRPTIMIYIINLVSVDVCRHESHDNMAEWGKELLGKFWSARTEKAKEVDGCN